MNSDTPVCMIVFNRPDKTRRVLEAVRQARPKTLVVVADGPRDGHPEDLTRCAAVRRLFEEEIDWPCETIRDYADGNLGCWSRVLSGVGGVFGNFESGIFLEDDCLPHPSFFSFCEELLARYRDDRRVSMISGNNFVTALEWPYSYYFSQIHNIWGWATWRDRWRGFDPEMNDWSAVKGEGALADILGDERRVAAWTDLFDYARDAKCWDFAWMFDAWRHNRFAAVPAVNLVTNIGYGPDGTNMRDPNHPQAGVPVREMPFPLVHPPRFIPCGRADRIYEGIIFPELGPAVDMEAARRREPSHLKKLLRLRALVRGILMLFVPLSWIHGSISERLRTKYRRS